MTTSVTIKASGDCYPARYTHVRKGQGVIAQGIVAQGMDPVTIWCGTEDHITVVEEYHKDGYKGPTGPQ